MSVYYIFGRFVGLGIGLYVVYKLISYLRR